MSRRLIILLCLFSLLLGGCWDRVEVEDLMYIVTIAIDKGEVSRYRVTARIPIVASLKSGILGGREGGAHPSEILSAEADSISQAMYIMNTSVTRRMTMRHLRAIFIGEDVAREGMTDLMAEMARNTETRGTAGFYVTRGSAGGVLRLAKWTGEYNAGKASEGVLLVEKYLHMAPPIRLHNILNRAGAIGVSTIGPVLAINTKVTSGRGAPSGESAVAGELNRYDGNPVELAGTAVFRDTNLAGFLTIDETQALLALRGEMGKAYMTIRDPFKPEQNIMIRFQQENVPKYIATFTPDGPHVSVRVLFEGEVLSGAEDYRSPTVRRRVEEAARLHMEKQMRKVLESLKEWQADPVGFGLLFRNKFRTWDDWRRYRWQDRVGQMTVDLTSSMRIRRYGLIIGAENALEE